MITGIIIRGVRSGGYRDERACTLVEPRREICRATPRSRHRSVPLRTPVRNCIVKVSQSDSRRLCGNASSLDPAACRATDLWK